MTTAPTPDPLPCPFCGGPVRVLFRRVSNRRSGHFAECRTCEVRQGQPQPCRDAAVKNWNRRAELGARKPLPLSYRAGAMTSSVDGGATVSLHFNDMAEAEAWFVAITDQHDAALVDKTANLQDRTAPLSDDDRLRLRSDVARAIWDVMREHEDRCGHALEDVEPKHQVWDCADAAIKVVRGLAGGSS